MAIDRSKKKSGMKKVNKNVKQAKGKTEVKSNQVESLRNTISGSIDISKQHERRTSIIEGISVSVAEGKITEVLPIIEVSPIENRKVERLVKGGLI